MGKYKIDRKIGKLDKYISKMLRKTKDKEVEKIGKELLSCLDSKYYAPKGITVLRSWRFFNFSVDEID